MNPFGYLFVVVGVFVLRQVIVGRATEIPADLRDTATALLSGDTDTVGEIMGRRGENVEGVDASGVAAPDADTPSTAGPISGPSIGSSGLANECIRLGTAAKGYVWGATGPSYYDCSGLVWKACVNIGVYSGPRFTTSTFTSVASKFASQVSSPALGDIVLWAGRHVGVSLGGDSMYSARSPSARPNIGKSTVSGDSGSFGMQPTYWRIK